MPQTIHTLLTQYLSEVKKFMAHILRLSSYMDLMREVIIHRTLMWISCCWWICRQKKWMLTLICCQNWDMSIM